ncbi:GNAT family N-acetyltransferase [Clostridium oceanicum]|uniref:N-acetyltransferase domain-containing protein n=1 Tax=Clostridium oceanicum TaxID=1543 RepID=A0ABP3UYA9_9CLOT
MYRVKIVDIKELEKMMKSYYESLIAPMDDYWEGSVLAKCKYYLLLGENSGENNIEDDVVIGFFAIGEDSGLYQFYLEEEYLYNSEDIFKFVVDEMKISKACVATYDTRFLVLCMDYIKDMKVSCYLYTECKKVDPEKPIENINIRLATLDDLEEIINFSFYSLDGVNEIWLKDYLTKWINKKGIYLFIDGTNIIGTGELRINYRYKNTAYLGIIVSKNHRGIGMGKYITSYLRKTADEKNLTAVLAADVNNTSSNKMIKNSGFYCYHRIMEVTFKK